MKPKDVTGTPEPIPTGDPDPARGSRRSVLLGLKVLAGLIIIAAPVYALSGVIPGLFGVAFFGVLAATFGWISGGVRVGASVVGALSVLGVSAVLLRDHIWALALILLLLGVAYGIAASRGVGKAVLQLPILTPYFMMKPPMLFTDPPIIDGRYVLGVLVIVNLAGLWAILVLHLATGTRRLTPVAVENPRVPLVFGAVLGLISAAVMVIGLSSGVNSHWVWVTLTLYLLADPTQLTTPQRMLGRLSGTFAGFGLVAILALVGIPDAVLQILALPALWFCVLYLLLKKPYWQYTFFLTVSVVLMNSRGINTLLLDAERFGFTLIGAALAVLAALLMNRLFHPSPQADQIPQPAQA